MVKINRNLSSKVVKSARWVARLLGLIPCLFYLIYFSGSLEDLKLAITTGFEAEIIIPILTLLTAGILGYIISWFAELHGGVIMIVIGVVVGFYLYYLSGWDNSQAMTIYAAPFVVSGLLYSNCWYRDYKAAKSRSNY